jgi:hypothetical protein
MGGQSGRILSVRGRWFYIAGSDDRCARRKYSGDRGHRCSRHLEAHSFKRFRVNSFFTAHVNIISYRVWRTCLLCVCAPKAMAVPSPLPADRQIPSPSGNVKGLHPPQGIQTRPAEPASPWDHDRFWTSAQRGPQEAQPRNWPGNEPQAPRWSRAEPDRGFPGAPASESSAAALPRPLIRASPARTTVPSRTGGGYTAPPSPGTRAGTRAPLSCASSCHGGRGGTCLTGPKPAGGSMIRSAPILE